MDAGGGPGGVRQGGGGTLEEGAARGCGQESLFGPDLEAAPARAAGGFRKLKVLITVKAAPNPSATYGETVCVAGVSAELDSPGWIRLYPVSFRFLEQDDKFSKYDVVEVAAAPATQDPRAESWKPRTGTLKTLSALRPWKLRRTWVDPYVEDSMCRLNRDARTREDARSLGLVRPADVADLLIEDHPGWTRDEQRKIDAYVSQLDLFGDEAKTPLQAPRFRARYAWRCGDRACNGHTQGLLDWEFVALQRRVAVLGDHEARRQLREKFLDQMCAAGRDVAFYVGNQAKRAHVFSVLGVYWPPKE